MNDSLMCDTTLISDPKNVLALFDAVQSGLALIDDLLNVVRMNKYMCQFFNISHDRFDGGQSREFFNCLHAQNNPYECGTSPECKAYCINLAIQETIRNGCAFSSQEGKVSSDIQGNKITKWVLYSVNRLVLDGNNFALLSIVDITGLRDSEIAMRMKTESYRALVQNTPDAIIRYDTSGRRMYVNPAYEKMFGIDGAQLIGKTPLETPYLSEQAGTLMFEAIAYVIKNKCIKEIEIDWYDNTNNIQHIHHSRFVPEYGDNGDVTSVLGFVHDKTQLKKYENELKQMAYYDKLTGLPNRILFNDRLEQLVKEGARNVQSVAGIMFLDLDNFKEVNDSLGHSAGDELIVKCGERIRSCLRDHDTVARLGGDEFAIILHDVRTEVDLATIAKKIQTVMEAPFVIQEKQLFMTTSIGISCFPADSRNADDLLQYADVAMYQAKMNGKNRSHFYSPILSLHATQRMELANDLRSALQGGEMEVYYQPKVNTLIGQLVGAEALLRWKHPTKGMIPPNEFISIAEDTGVIDALGSWVLQVACKTAVEWNSGKNYPIIISVNVSGRQFMSGDLVETVRSALTETNCSPKLLELEITENILMSDIPETIATLETLSKMGLSLSIDDFGTGYSALSYLIDFPIDVIKIDKKFINDITTQKKSYELVRAFVMLGRSLGLELVAEGVETIEQVASLDKLGCHIIQGYFYGKPMPLREFNLWRDTFHNNDKPIMEVAPENKSSSWRDYLTTGNSMIDSQHKEIFQRITTLSECCRKGKGHTKISEMLDYLADYVVTHFSAEENLMLTANAPNYIEHKTVHDNFIDVVQTLLAKYKSEGESTSLVVEVNYIAVNWLTKHICTLDRELAGYISTTLC